MATFTVEAAHVGDGALPPGTMFGVTSSGTGGVPFGSGAMPLSGVVITAAAAPGKTSPVVWAIVSVALVGIGYWIVWSVVPEPTAPLVLKEGIAMFGLFVLAAQAIERAIDPFTTLDVAMKNAIGVRDEKCTDARRNPSEATAQAAAQSQADVDEKKTGRSFFWWAIATVAGLLVSKGLGLYAIASVLDASSAHPPKSLDLLITGLILGGGTKPLHDLTSQLAKSKEAAKTPNGAESTA